MRKAWIVLGLAVAVSAAWFGHGYYQRHLKVDPDELVRQALERTLSASSYRYEVEVELVTEGQKRVMSRVSGERDGKENFHIRGELAGDQVEVYQIEDTTYLLDPKTGKWMVVPGNELRRQRMLMAEIDPLSLLRFNQWGGVSYWGREKKSLVAELRPVPASEFMTTWFEEFACRLWIDRRTRLIQKVVFQAKSRTNPEAQATFTVNLRDFGAEISLSPPV